VDRLERPAQLLGVLAPLALALDGEGGIERATLARIADEIKTRQK
jgi:hypothetical protein